MAPMRTVHEVKSNGDEPGIWAAALGHDGDAFAAIFDLHRDRVYRHALRITANVHDAEDVTAAAFFELWRRRKSVRIVDGSVAPWLLVTTTNVARNLARSLRRYQSLIASLPRSEDTRSAEDAALKRLEAERVAEQLRHALRQLTPSDAGLIALVMLEHYSPAQAAVVLGISDGAARTRLHRARTRAAAAIEALSATDTNDTTKEKSR
jgi:RNA polymerase sigma factor (sigma-70 family)